VFNDRSSVIAFLKTRRSGKPRNMMAPGPSEEELETIFGIATRVPDHGKLAPWRFVVIQCRDSFAALLDRAYRLEKPEPTSVELRAIDAFARQGATLIVAIARPTASSKIPVYEQMLSVGAAIYNLELAATSMGYLASWLTGWAAYSPVVLKELGGTGDEKIAGFLFLGSPVGELEERVRPDLGQVVSYWSG
jgi:nitroreductase